MCCVLRACMQMYVYFTRNFQFHLFSVIRAKVFAQEVINGSRPYSGVRVFQLEILETFKGASRLNQTEGIHGNGPGQRSLFAKAYTPRYDSMCGVSLRSGTVYLLGGYIRKGKLQLELCSLNEKWSQVTPGRRLGISRVYGQNCECQISPCYVGNSCGDLKGCTYHSELRRHSPYCLKSANGTSCSWSNTTSVPELFPSPSPSTSFPGPFPTSIDSFPGLFFSPSPSKLPRETPSEQGSATYRYVAASMSKATNISFCYCFYFIYLFFFKQFLS